MVLWGPRSSCLGGRKPFVSVRRDVEVELKYELADERLGERLLGAEHLGSLSPLGPVDVVRHDDRYFDTGTGALADAGFAARLRRTPTETLLTVKSLRGTDGALHQREELETPVPPVLDPRVWPASNARALILELCGDAELVEVVRLRQLRRRRLFGDADTSVEVSLDSVEVLRDEATIDAFVELEIELQHGAASDLTSVSGALEGLPGLAPSRRSKLERALAAVRRQAAARMPPPGKSPGVKSDDLLSEAGRKVLRFHFARMIAREQGTRVGTDPEDLHAMRVATRRMRAAWRVFGEAFRRGKTRRIRRSLREVAGRLGAVRDLDVLIDACEQYRAGLAPADQSAMQPLVDAWRGRRDDARRLLIEELDADSYRSFVEEFRALVTEEGAAARAVEARLPHLVRDTAPAGIWAAYHTVRAYESVLRWADIETLHALRIDAKRLRYSLEFFRETLGPEGGTLIGYIVALQDHLGALHDSDVAAGLTRSFLVEHAAELEAPQREAIGRYLIHSERAVTGLRRSVGRPWRGVVGVGFRRGLGKALARL
jgi:triphosphatase